MAIIDKLKKTLKGVGRREAEKAIRSLSYDVLMDAQSNYIKELRSQQIDCASMSVEQFREFLIKKLLKGAIK